MSTLIRLICPNLKCRKVLTVPENTRGKMVRCRSCGMRINVPADKPTPAAPTDSAEASA